MILTDKITLKTKLSLFDTKIDTVQRFRKTNNDHVSIIKIKLKDRADLYPILKASKKVRVHDYSKGVYFKFDFTESQKAKRKELIKGPKMKKRPKMKNWLNRMTLRIKSILSKTTP